MTKKIAAAALTAASLVASPALARDGKPYVGVDAGAMFVKDIHATATETFSIPVFPGFPGPLGGLSSQAASPAAIEGDDRFVADLDTGFDGDIVVGYDWGYVRTEIEASYRRAHFNKVRVAEGDFFGGTHDASGKISSRSVVLNLLGDLPLGKGFTVSAGPGLGWSSIRANPKVDLSDNGDPTHLQSTKDNGWMLQGIVGVRKEVTANLDIGVKYRFVRSGRRSYDSTFYGEVEGRLKAHSLLASLTYSFGSSATQ